MIVWNFSVCNSLALETVLTLCVYPAIRCPQTSHATTRHRGAGAQGSRGPLWSPRGERWLRRTKVHIELAADVIILHVTMRQACLHTANLYTQVRTCADLTVPLGLHTYGLKDTSAMQAPPSQPRLPHPQLQSTAAVTCHLY